MASKPEYRTVEEYMALPYTIEVVRDRAENWNGWFAKVRELPGCMTQIERLDELEEMIKDATRVWIETAIEEGIPIPEPLPHEEYSGKFMTRVPKSLHRELAEAAAQNGVSLNAFVNMALAKAVGLQMEKALNAADLQSQQELRQDVSLVTQALQKTSDHISSLEATFKVMNVNWPHQLQAPDKLQVDIQAFIKSRVHLEVQQAYQRPPLVSQHSESFDTQYGFSWVYEAVESLYPKGYQN